MGWGWYLSDAAGNRTVALEVNFFDGTKQTVPCLINRARDDVAQAYPANPQASTAGFIFLSKLVSRSRIGSASLSVALDNGTTQNHQLQGFPERFAPDSIAPQAVATRIQKVWRLAKAGKATYLLTRLGTSFKQHSRTLVNRIANAQWPHENVDLLFDHQLGGGANKFREDKIAQILHTGNAAVLVTFDLPRLLFRLEITSSRGKLYESYEDLSTLRERLSETHFSTVHVNNFVSYPDPLAMLQLVKKLIHSNQSQLTLYLHDFHMVCPSYTLINSDGIYCGVPNLEVCIACLKTNESIFPSFVRIREVAPWREAWHELLHAATNIVAFSASTVDIIQRAFPANDWLKKVTLQPHVIDVARYPKLKPNIFSPLKIAVIGNINFGKGAGVVHDLLALIEQNQLAVSIVVIGTLERYSASPALIVTGPFDNSMLPKLLQQHGVGICWLPSICPETFSYVTEEVITMEMPMVCFDLGAPAERVKRYRWGEVARETSARGALDAILSLAKRVATEAI